MLKIVECQNWKEVEEKVKTNFGAYSPGLGILINEEILLNLIKKLAPKTRKGEQTHLPKDFKPTEEHEKLASSLGIDLSRELEKFVHYYTDGKGYNTRNVRWNQTFTMWLKNAKEYQKDKKNVWERREQTIRNQSGIFDDIED